MSRNSHLILSGTVEVSVYTSTSGGGKAEFAHPPRDRIPHAVKLERETRVAQRAAEQKVNSSGAGITVRGLALECMSSVDDFIEADRLDDRRSNIELLSVRKEGGRTSATIYIPNERIGAFLKKIERYKTEIDSRRIDRGPKNKALVESIEAIRLPVMRSFWVDSTPFPESTKRKIWIEAWIREDADRPNEVLPDFRAEASRVGLEVDEKVIRFPSRLVVIVYGSVKQWTESVLLLGSVAELRLAKQIATDFIELPPRDLAPMIDDATDRIIGPSASAPAVCLLDTGIEAKHPLLEKIVSQREVQAVESYWPTGDDHGHGTEMAGLAAFGETLPDHLMGAEQLSFEHRLESVKLVHPTQQHDPESYGAKTQEAVAKAEVVAPNRSRVVCLAITADDRDMGLPSSWSAAIDQHSSGALEGGDARRLYVVSAGNIRDLDFKATAYPVLNRTQRGIEDPAQSWNALTVGACTHRVAIRDENFEGHVPVAAVGGLSPRCRTSLMWETREWPLKPDVVMEGGNYAAQNGGEVLHCDDLRLLTTSRTNTGKQLETMADTSAATALAARLGARLSASYPGLWPETLRGIIVHSAEWTKQMVEDFPGETREAVGARLRCYGYGQPNEERAFWTAENSVTLISQEHIIPFQRNGSSSKTRDCHFHKLPWPSDVLDSLGNEPITVRVTLSYFIEPSPGRRGWERKFRYASHGLRFAMRGGLESDSDFLKRITREEWTDEEREDRNSRPETSDPQNWVIGSRLRARGSIHSDWFTAPAVEVARAGCVAVHPVTGWWKERHHLGRIDQRTRYALVITIRSPEETLDLLTPIRQAIAISTPSG